MHPDQSLPNDPRRELDSEGNAQRIGRLEQSMKKAQPRPPRLDMKAIDHALEERERQPVTVARVVEVRSGWHFGPAGLIAASWACGAIAGALLTFFLLGRGTAQSPPLAEQSQEEAIKVEEKIDLGRVADHSLKPTPSTSKENASFTGSSLIAMNLVDPYSRMPSLGDLDSPVLRVGMYTHRSLAASLRREEGGLGDGWSRSRRPERELHRSRSLDTERKPASTRDHIMQDLLGDVPGSVL
jgi:hypothetical protein